MPISPAARREAARLKAAFEAAGALPVEADTLLPADTLLDLYGEDIRGRAYVTQDPLLGEMMLRPDFTVPVVQMHMAHGAEPARYCYSGEVFRRQDRDEGRAREYLQTGYEVFARENPAESDAEVFAMFSQLLMPLKLRAVIGDIGLLLAAVNGLTTSETRKAALRRHVWRPKRFRALLDRFSGAAPVAPARVKLLEKLATGSAEALMQEAGPFIGQRSPAEVEARAQALLEDAGTRHIPTREADLLDDLLRVEGAAPEALKRLEDIGTELSSIRPAIALMEARLEALSEHGINVDRLGFEASHGRTTMEYYDGFVFSFMADQEGLPPVANGGRYDALTRVLGQGREIPAVGGIIRPGLLAQLKEARV